MKKNWKLVQKYGSEQVANLFENEGYAISVEKDGIRIGSERKNQNVQFRKWMRLMGSEW